MLNPLQGKARFGIEEWASFVGDVRLVSEDLTMRELRLAFWWSRMVVVDEARPPPRAPEYISRARAVRSSSDSDARGPMIVSPIPPLVQVKSRLKFTTLTWTQFVEALARVADMMSVPTDADLASIGAGDIMSFEEKLADADADTQARLRRPRPSAEFGAPKTRGVHVKLDRLLRLVIGRFGILGKGSLQHGTKKMSLVSANYITEEQTKTMTL